MQLLLLICSIIILNSCGAKHPEFDGKKAFEFLLEQCDLGPRFPGSNGHKECKKFIVNLLNTYADSVIKQDFTYSLGKSSEVQKGTNIIALFSPQLGNHILLGAHWDTRPIADQDLEHQNKLKPIIGANDGASGVSVLLHLAEIMSNKKPPRQVSLAFFDAEDSGDVGDNSSYCIGSTYFSKNLPIDKPLEGVILDMVGDKNLEIPIERYSYKYNKKLVKKLWKRAKDLNLKSFKNYLGYAIYDDHVPLNDFAGIPTIDIIDFNYPNTYLNYWHTVNDIAQNCSPESLREVGTLMIDYIYNKDFIK